MDASPDLQTIGAQAQIDAIKLVASGKLNTSDMGKLLSDAAKEGLMLAGGPAIMGLKDAALELGDTFIQSTIGTTLTQISEAVPFVGTFVSLFTQMIAAVLGLNKREMDARYCQALGSMTPPKTGSLLNGSSTVPADIFAPFQPTPNALKDGDNSLNLAVPPPWRIFLDPYKSAYWDGLLPGVWYYPSLLGMALQTVTEGSPVGPDEVRLEELIKGPTAKALSSISVHNGFKGLSLNAAKAKWLQEREITVSKSGGLDLTTRKHFAKMRRAIQSAFGPHLRQGVVSDGGASIWPAWLDYLYAQNLDRYRIRRILAAYPMFGNPNVENGCVDSVTEMVTKTIDGWKNTIQPYYTQGRSELEKVKADIKATIRSGDKSKAAKQVAFAAPQAQEAKAGMSWGKIGAGLLIAGAGAAVYIKSQKLAVDKDDED